MRRIFSCILLLIFLLSTPRVYAAMPSLQEEQLIKLLTQIIILLQEQLRLLQARHAITLQTSPPSEAIVYLRCRYAPKNGAGEEVALRGTGVTINPEGQILTVRHLVDPLWAAQSYPNDPNTSLYHTIGEGYISNGCEVSTISALLPSSQEIKTINPRISAGSPQYEAVLSFVPQKDTMSDEEYASVDFALLKTVRIFECATCALPRTFPHVVIRTTPEAGTPELVSYGYPIEGPPSNVPFLKGAVGNLVKYFSGNARFANTPFLFEWTANDSRQGRSGSPIFSLGKLIGIEIGATENNVTQNYALGMPAIHSILTAHGAATSTVK